MQLTSTPDPDANFVAAEEQIELAARRGAELVGLPENFAFMGEDSRRLELAPALAERCSRFLVTMARRYQVTLLGGGFPVPAGAGKTFNRPELVGTEVQLLAGNDGYGFFAAAGGLVVTGPTLTNVNDFRAILIDRPAGS